MNTATVAILAAIFGLCLATPLNENERITKDEALAKAKGVKQCIVQYKDAPDANEQIPKCILGVFGEDIEVAKQKLQVFLKTAGEDAQKYLYQAGTEVYGYYQAAKDKALSYVGVVGDKLGKVKDSVLQWVDKTIG